MESCARTSGKPPASLALPPCRTFPVPCTGFSERDTGWYSASSIGCRDCATPRTQSASSDSVISPDSGSPSGLLHSLADVEGYLHLPRERPQHCNYEVHTMQSCHAGSNYCACHPRSLCTCSTRADAQQKQGVADAVRPRQDSMVAACESLAALQARPRLAACIQGTPHMSTASSALTVV